MTKLDGDILTLGLRGQLFAEGAGKAWVCMQRPNGDPQARRSPASAVRRNPNLPVVQADRAVKRRMEPEGMGSVAVL